MSRRCTFTAEGDGLDHDLFIALLAEQGDEEVQLIKDFEDQLIEVCQENQGLAMCRKKCILILQLSRSLRSF